MKSLDIKLSAGENPHPAENHLSGDSLDVKINNGSVEAVRDEEIPKETSEEISEVAEEYYQEIFDIIEEASQQEETSEAIEEPAEIVEEMAEEIFEEILDEIEDAEETVAEQETEAEQSEEQAYDEVEIGNDSQAILKIANTVLAEEKTSDKALSGFAKSAEKDKSDFLNLCVLAICMLFLGMTFIFMKGEKDIDDVVKLDFESVKKGTYTQYISQWYTEKMPLERIMTQANVAMRKLFGKTDLKFVSFKDNEPPNGPVDTSDMGGSSAQGDVPENKVTTTAQSVTGETTTTPKLPQNFEITGTEDEDPGNVFTGRPIKTTTTKVTTTVKHPQTTETTTTGEVNLILP